MENLQQFLPFVLILGAMYFLMIRPQQNRVKKEKEFESNLKVGDKIITKAGIHGRISEIAETTIIVETMAGKMKMEKAAISLELSQKANANPVVEKK
ncbi:preprotein translocase subunit YajC [Flavobacterium sp. xlx-214]|uniref:preprotein translocase subunit YajC n=1 Tax=unclassified Flavobacterium TaxID=196869 RepID=UPI0013D36697|nr:MULTISPECIES: preprotein translocase subunit YajC [unclassified Flavobacterium]MBA5792804.1 preprotein translocase subunit YajC [Flavobacterium sp. xlx-221]QMI83940.1 preprotein translocase subunit YajC [Flavobacterium sp. xlx-214]